MSLGASGTVSRRKFLRGAAAGALAGRGIYALLDEFATPQRAFAAPPANKQEQYLIDRLEVILDNGTTCVIPPIYNDVITAKLSPDIAWDRTTLRAAQTRLEQALAKVEAPYPSTAAGLTIVVAWGLPYFNGYVSSPWGSKAPKSGAELAVLPPIRFPSDAADVALEDNHVAFKMRSDSQTILHGAEAQLFENVGGPAYVGDLFQLTSKRIGFLGRGFGTTAAVKQLAKAAGLAVWQKIPDKAQLSMGFTSTQTEALGPDILANFETLRGVTDQFPSGYFAHGCSMHLSHLNLDLEAWYGKSYADRVKRMFSPRTTVPANTATVTIPNGAATVATKAQVEADAKNGVVLGHNQLLQMATRLGADTLDNYGRLRRKGTPIPVREDFNTLDNPFAWYRDGSEFKQSTAPARTGMHFAAFVPSSGAFHRARSAMDGVLPGETDATSLRKRYNLTDDKIGINSSMRATHRQNFLVPPRAHRSFPLVELL